MQQLMSLFQYDFMILAFAAILIIVAVAGGLGYIFQKYGRR